MRGFWRVNLHKSVLSCVEKKSTTSNNILKFPPLFFSTLVSFQPQHAQYYTILKEGKDVDKSLWNTLLTAKINRTTCSVLFYLLILLFPFFCQRLANF